ncbi:hypothetical protein DH2020_005176 [Rehmannia glutinosa]|uniref:Uncharacterized protein n=1 Tax=Rehmannia glutinosa TaxID=99300 RepID=A0ABR0XRW8_REHGL
MILWGDRFITQFFDPQVTEKYSKTIKVLKNEVKSMVTAPESNMIDTMNLIDTINTLDRLGISYHFENEIEEKLEQFFNLDTNYEDETYDLYTVALHFRLFRQHGYRIRYDTDGKFQEGLKSDARGLLSLFEASHLRIHGENILDGALAFATSNLISILPSLIGSPLGNQVVHALVQPLHFGIPRLEARYFISIYEEYDQKDETLLRFAKLDFNLLQMLHKEELQEISRDRVVECFFWAMGVYHEPHYSRARIMLAKTIAITSIIDDTYDAYGTIEELDIFTEAIQR